MTTPYVILSFATICVFTSHANQSSDARIRKFLNAPQKNTLIPAHSWHDGSVKERNANSRVYDFRFN